MAYSLGGWPALLTILNLRTHVGAPPFPAFGKGGNTKMPVRKPAGMPFLPPWKADADEVIRRVEVIFARFVNDPDLLGGGLIVRHQAIDLPQLQRGRIIGVLNTDHEERLRAIHSGRNKLI